MAKLSQFAQKSLRDSFKDASGMLTGFGQGIPPVQPAQQFNTGGGGGGIAGGKELRNIAGILTGRDFSTDEEIEKEKLQEIIDTYGVDSPQYRTVILQKLAKTDPMRAMELATINRELNLKDQQRQNQQVKSTGFSVLDKQLKEADKSKFLDPEFRKLLSDNAKNFGISPVELNELLSKEIKIRNDLLGTGATATDSIKEYNLAKKEGYAGTFTDYLQNIEGKNKKADSKRETAKDARGILRYVDTKEPVFPDAANIIISNEIAEKASEREAKTVAAAAVRKSNFSNKEELARLVESGGVSPEEAYKQLQLPPEIIELNVELNKEALNNRDIIFQQTELLAQYNKNVPPVGEIDAQVAKAKEWFEGTGIDQLPKYNLEAVRVNTANAMLPPGPATDTDVARVDGTIPSATSQPAVIREWLLSNMRMAALVAANKEAQAEWAVNNRGNMTGFNENWHKQVDSVDKVNAIYKKFKVPSNANFLRKEVKY